MQYSITPKCVALGLALLQRHGQLVHTSEELMEAPIDKIEEAAVLHKFAEAAYTVYQMII